MENLKKIDSFKTDQKIEFTSKLFASVAAFSGKWSEHIMNAVDNLDSSVAGAIPGAPTPTGGTTTTGGGSPAIGTTPTTPGGAAPSASSGTAPSGSAAPGFGFVTETNKTKYSLAAKGMAGGSILLGAAAGAMGIANLFEPGDMDRIGEAIEGLDARLEEDAEALQVRIQKLGDEVIALIQHESLDDARNRIFHAELIIENYKKNYAGLLSGFINCLGKITNIVVATPPLNYAPTIFQFSQNYPCPYELGGSPYISPQNYASFYTENQINNQSIVKGFRAKPTFIADLFNGRNLNFKDGENTFYIQCEINSTSNNSGFIGSLNSFSKSSNENGVELDNSFSINTFNTGDYWKTAAATSCESDWEILTYANKTDFPSAESAAASNNWKKPTNKNPYSIAVRQSGNETIQHIKYKNSASGDERLLSFDKNYYQWKEQSIDGTVLTTYYEADTIYYQQFGISKKKTLLLTSCQKQANTATSATNILTSKIIKIDFEEQIICYNNALFDDNIPTFVAFDEIGFEYYGKKDIVQVLLDQNSTFYYDAVSNKWFEINQNGSSFAFVEAPDDVYYLLLGIQPNDIASSNCLLLVDNGRKISFKIDLKEGKVSIGTLSSNSFASYYTVVSLVYQSDKKIDYDKPYGEVSGIDNETNAQWIWDDSNNQYAWIRCKMPYNLEAHSNMENYFKQVNQTNIINYISDDLADSIFKIFMLTLNMDGFTKQGIFEMVYEQAFKNSTFPETESKKSEAGYALSTTASYYTQLIIRGLKGLAFIRTTKEEALYLKANNIAHVSLLTKEQQAELQSNQSFAIYGIIELFANSNEQISLWKKFESKLNSIPLNEQYL